MTPIRRAIAGQVAVAGLAVSVLTGASLASPPPAESASVPVKSASVPVALTAIQGTLSGFASDQVIQNADMCLPGNICEIIPGYNPWEPNPTGNNLTALRNWAAVPGHDVASGISLGGATISVCIQQQCAPTDTVFYLFGTPSPYDDQVPTDSPYPAITVLDHQYDFVADQPDQWWNLLAWANLSMARHCCYTAGDLTDPQSATWTDGNVTYIVTRADTMPLVAWLGPDIAAALDAPLRYAIEGAYDRDGDGVPDNVDPTFTAIAAPVSSATAVSTTVAEPVTVSEPVTARVSETVTSSEPVSEPVAKKPRRLSVTKNTEPSESKSAKGETKKAEVKSDNKSEAEAKPDKKAEAKPDKKAEAKSDKKSA